MDKVICGNCKTLLQEAYGLPADRRQECPACGAKKRTYTKHLLARTVFQAGVSLKAFENGVRKPFIRLTTIPSFSFKLQCWVHLYRLLDRRHDVYHEVVTDQKDGTVIHECHEPLSAHKGHGSARKSALSKDI